MSHRDPLYHLSPCCWYSLSIFLPASPQVKLQSATRQLEEEKQRHGEVLAQGSPAEDILVLAPVWLVLKY